jgi:SAM-dependent methyltransferase
VDAERKHWWYRGRRRILLRLLERHLQGRTHRILDIGSGTGSLLLSLRRFGSVRGIETDAELRNHARAQQLQIDDLDFPREIPPGRFDVVTMFDVLEHLENDLEALRAIHQLLDPGGLLFLTVPALSWLYSTYDEAAGHYRRYDHPVLKRRVLDAGFKLLRQTHFNTFLLPLAMAARIFRLRDGHRPPDASTCDRLGALEDLDLRIPAAPLNEVLAQIFGSETSWAAGPGLPIGVSLMVVARKEAAPGTAV